MLFAPPRDSSRQPQLRTPPLPIVVHLPKRGSTRNSKASTRPKQKQRKHANALDVDVPEASMGEVPAMIKGSGALYLNRLK